MSSLNVNALWRTRGRRRLRRSTCAACRRARCRRSSSRSRPAATRSALGVSYRIDGRHRRTTSIECAPTSLRPHRRAYMNIVRIPVAARCCCSRCRSPAARSRRSTRRRRARDRRAARRPRSPALPRPRVAGAHPRARSAHVTRPATCARSLAKGPTPRIILLHGGVYPGPPDDGVVRQLPDRDGLSRSAASAIPAIATGRTAPTDEPAQLAGLVAWEYEHDGMRPMLIGHSQGGLYGGQDPEGPRGPERRQRAGVESAHGTLEERTTIVDPLTGTRAAGGRASPSPTRRPSAPAGSRCVLPNWWERPRHAAQDSRHRRRVHRLFHRRRPGRVEPSRQSAGQALRKPTARRTCAT